MNEGTFLARSARKGSSARCEFAFVEEGARTAQGRLLVARKTVRGLKEERGRAVERLA